MLKSRNFLLVTYAHNGHFSLAKSSFDDMQQKNAVTWGVMLKMYGDNDCFSQVGLIYQRMPMYDQVSWNAMLAAYAVHGHLQKMKDLFSKMPVKDSVSCNTVLAALGDRGLVNDARCLFDEMTNRDIVSWTCLLQANASREENQEFLAIRDKMPAWNSVSNLATLQKHIQISQLEAAKNAFDSLAEIRSVAAWTAMVGGYGDSGHLGAATAIFHKMPQWSIVSWTALLRAHARDSAAAARKIFVAMPGKNIASWNAMLAASAQSFESSDLLLHRMPAWDLITLTAAVAIFSQSGHIDRARVFFDAMPEKDPASWNAMVAAYGRRPGGAAALDLFQEMLLEGGLEGDRITFATIFGACSKIQGLEEGKNLHEKLQELGLDLNAVGTSLISMYGQCGSVEDARRVFNSMKHRSPAVWNSMVAAYSQNGYTKKALELYWKMEFVGVERTEITYVSALAACAKAGLLEDGREIHGHVVVSGLESSESIGAGLINMYSKCGSLDSAKAVFERAPSDSLLFWTSMLSAFSRHGQLKQALVIFRRM
ncbi:hypothetical protein SELMODRAFT_125425, partial [Selaginella moellendorffii]